MIAVLGEDHPTSITEAASGDGLARFMGRLIELGHRQDRVRNAAEFVAAVAAAGAGPLDLRTIAAVSPSASTGSYGRLRQLLDGGACDPTALRRGLIGEIPVGLIAAVLVEFAETRPSEHAGWDTFSVHALGPGISIPIGWRRVVTASTRRGFESPNLSDAERGALLGLLDEARADLASCCGIEITELPLLSVETCFGECELTRAALAERRFETFLEVGGAFEGLNLDRGPFEPQVPTRIVAEQLPFVDGDPPEPREIMIAGGRSGEFAVAHRRDESRGWAIARPRIDQARDGITGRRRLEGAVALRELRNRLVVPEAARRLRLSDFRHASEEGWLTAAMLLSTAYAKRPSDIAEEEVA